MDFSNKDPIEKLYADKPLTMKQVKEEMHLRKTLLPFVDDIVIKRGRSGIWEVVDMILNFMEKYHRKEMRDILMYVKQQREIQQNQFGSSDNKSVRYLGTVPNRVETLLRRVYEDELPMSEKKFKREFMKRYPEFRVAKII